MITKTRIWHHRLSNGVLTLVAEQTQIHTEFVTKIGWAWCSPRDQFNRKKGRMIARSRLKNVPLTIFSNTERRWNEVMRWACSTLVKDGHAPSWVRPEDIRPKESHAS